MKVTLREFQRNFAKARKAASGGEPVLVVSKSEKFVFQRVPQGNWQGALKGKATIKGDLFSTDLDWETLK